VPGYFAFDLVLIRFHIFEKSGGGVHGLSAIQYVTSGLTLIAFVVAFAFNAYRLKLKQRSEIIQKTPAKDRLKAISVTAEMFHIDIQGGQLKSDALERVVLEQMRLKERRNSILSIVAVILALLLAIVAIVAIVAPDRSQAHTVSTIDTVAIEPNPDISLQKNQSVNLQVKVDFTLASDQGEIAIVVNDQANHLLAHQAHPVSKGHGSESFTIIFAVPSDAKSITVFIPLTEAGQRQQNVLRTKIFNVQ
jgi:hypothetical protein